MLPARLGGGLPFGKHLLLITELRQIANPARVEDADVEIAVTDDGPGIPEDQLEHIFERFVRGDAGLTQRVGGTGLGLAISKSLVELHGGTLAVDSTPGRGSTFSFRLPKTAADGPIPHAYRGESAHRREGEG